MENDHQQIGQVAPPYPPGYRFMPTDAELIAEYLVKKINNVPIPIADICEVNLYEHTPSYLAANFPQLGDNEHYFFTPRDRKYPNGNRPNRAVGDEGYWKATGADKAVITKTGQVIGGKKVLVFYYGKPKPEVSFKTSWIMHEFRLNAPSKTPNRKDMRLDDWVLCRIYKKKKTAGKEQKEIEEGEKENVEEIVALDNNNNNIENAAINRQNEGGGASTSTVMIEGGQNGYLQSQPSYYQEGYNQAIPNNESYDPFLFLAGTSEENHGMDFGGDLCSELIYYPQYQELAWGDFDHGILGNQGTMNNSGAINFQQQYPCAPNVDVGLKKFADEFVRDEKADFSNDAAESKK